MSQMFLKNKYVFILFSTIIIAYGVEKPIEMDNLPFNATTRKEIINGRMFVESIVESIKSSDKTKLQTLFFHSSGLHKRTCRRALRKISMYEKHKDYLNFVEASSYDEKEQRINLLLSSPILPIKMVMNFKIPRIKRPGLYKFVFDRGFLKNLQGEIHVTEYKKRCLFYTKATWRGPDTKFPDILLEFFSSTLGKIGIESLFRISTN